MSWERARLRSITDVITKGTTPTTLGYSFVERGIPFLRVQNVDGGRVCYEQNTLFIDEQTHQALLRSQIRTGDVLVSIAGTIGRAGIVPDHAPPLNCNQALAIIRPTQQIFRPFLRLWLESSEAQRQMRGSTVTATISNLSLSQLGDLKVPLPPLAEQRRIAKVLDRADTLRAKRRVVLSKIDTLPRSIFLDLFGDPVTNPKAWPREPFSEIGALDRGISKHRPRNAPELLGGPYPLVQTGEVANCDGYIRNYYSTYSEIGLRQSKMWPSGTLCITIAANIAKTGILTFDACFPDSIVGFRTAESATVEYIRCWLSFIQKSLEDAAPESAQKNINLALLRSLVVPLPPIELQREFARRVAAVEKLRAVQRASMRELDALFFSLQHRAFRGEL